MNVHVLCNYTFTHVYGARVRGYMLCVCSMPHVQDDQSAPLTCDVYVGPNCEVEVRADGGEVSTGEGGEDDGRGRKRE